MRLGDHLNKYTHVQNALFKNPPCKRNNIYITLQQFITECSIQETIQTPIVGPHGLDSTLPIVSALTNVG